MEPDGFDCAEILQRHGQEHLLEALADCDAQSRAAVLRRIAEIDWVELAAPAEPIDLEAVQPSQVVDVIERQRRHDDFAAAGEAIYRAGQVAICMVAGGQGTRLGFDGAKGCFEIGVHSGKSIYQIQAEKVLSLSRRVGHAVPFLVMTSPATDAETRSFFAAHDHFGLASGQLRFFVQGTVPSLDDAGRALFAEPGRLLENPDGHGGCFTALLHSGELARLASEGIRQLVYIQVDNLLAPVDDPILVGVAEAESADVVTKVLPKAHPDEKLGHLLRIGDRDRIVEYTELSAEQVRSRDEAGELLFRWGSPAMHCWRIGFLVALAARGFRLPVHRSRKPLHAWVDGREQEVQGCKNERFIFDLIPEATRSIGLEIDRASEFAPVKNAEGADSPASAQRLASDCWTAWLREQGCEVQVGEHQRIEISPLYAATFAQFAQRWAGERDSISGDFYLEESN